MALENIRKHEEISKNGTRTKAPTVRPKNATNIIEHEDKLQIATVLKSQIPLLRPRDGIGALIDRMNNEI